MKTPTSEKRDEIVRQAYAVFFKNGFHASGVDSLLKGTGISKRTLYNYFESKEDLIKATVEYYNQNTFQAISTFIETSKVRSPLARALLIFDWLEAVLESGHTLGCFAVNAKIEYANRDTSIERACENYFAKVETLVADTLIQGGYKEAKKMAPQLILLFQGAILSAQGNKSMEPVRIAKMAAKTLLESASG
jgi:AcrR family transcriptional regulator